MKGIVRKTDQFSGICLRCDGNPSVTGQVHTASNDVFNNGLGVARYGDTILASCGHYGFLYATGKTMVNGRQVGLLGDVVGNDLDGTIVSASSDFGEN